MDLPSVNDLKLDEISLALLRDVDETSRRVNELRPLSTSIIEAVQRDLLGERVYSSNAIEGNSFNLGETIETLRTGHITVGRKREATEVINLGNAIEHLQAHLLAASDPYCESEFLELHRLLYT